MPGAGAGTGVGDAVKNGVGAGVGDAVGAPGAGVLYSMRYGFSSVLFCRLYQPTVEYGAESCHALRLKPEARGMARSAHGALTTLERLERRV